MDTAVNIEILGAAPSAEEAAALATALAVLLSAPASPPAAPASAAPPSMWEESGKLVRQGLAPARVRVLPRWRTIERQRRETGGGFYGVVGL